MRITRWCFGPQTRRIRKNSLQETLKHWKLSRPIVGKLKNELKRLKVERTELEVKLTNVSQEHSKIISDLQLELDLARIDSFGKQDKIVQHLSNVIDKSTEVEITESRFNLEADVSGNPSSFVGCAIDSQEKSSRSTSPDVTNVSDGLKMSHVFVKLHPECHDLASELRALVDTEELEDMDNKMFGYTEYTTLQEPNIMESESSQVNILESDIAIFTLKGRIQEL